MRNGGGANACRRTAKVRNGGGANVYRWRAKVRESGGGCVRVVGLVRESDGADA